MLHIDHLTEIVQNLENEIEDILLVKDVSRMSNEEVNAKLNDSKTDLKFLIQSYLELRKVVKEMFDEKTQFVHFAVSKMKPFSYVLEELK